MRPDATRIYHDPLHGAIALAAADPVERLLIELIDTSAFQRLRRIRQLGPASLTFHGAEASRFTHSLGVMHIARRAFDLLAKRYPELLPHRATVLGAALLHDIGHGPFSHTCEDIFGSNHEHWTARILRESPEISGLMAAYDPALLDQILAVYTKQHPLPLVSQLVSSQLDCDRLDYLMRDSYFTGASYGKLDLDRILGALRYDRESGLMVVTVKGMAAIEHYLIVRSLMYSQVYTHPKNIAANWMLQGVFRRARELVSTQGPEALFADAVMGAWLQGDRCNDLALNEYLEADDGLFLYHLQRWQTNPDPVLSDLSRRYSDRDLFKAKDVTDLSPEDLTTVCDHVAAMAEAQGYPASYYVGNQTSKRSGYSRYKQGIQIQVDGKLQEMGERSPLVQALVQMQRKSWLIYPRFLEGEV